VLGEISPEPEPGEREALLAALNALAKQPPRGSAWWEAGIRGAVGDSNGVQLPADEGSPGPSPARYASARPRRTRGAARA
jgi:hypothetical protein